MPGKNAEVSEVTLSLPPRDVIVALEVRLGDFFGQSAEIQLLWRGATLERRPNLYLLAVGGTNSTSRLSVTGIGRTAAERIFYRALTVKLTSSANFKAVRTATLSAAADLYGTGSTQYNATAAAWSAVGVQ